MKFNFSRRDLCKRMPNLSSSHCCCCVTGLWIQPLWLMENFPGKISYFCSLKRGNIEFTPARDIAKEEEEQIKWFRFHSRKTLSAIKFVAIVIKRGRNLIKMELEISFLINSCSEHFRLPLVTLALTISLFMEMRAESKCCLRASCFLINWSFTFITFCKYIFGSVMKFE